ncbi:uncharacterized protein si:dkeyp-97a10.3 [Corythoichthys intestinalis]|uniref:uncharacterized protein si:dkeyp-97a10.3 n=1 Tax=Corythoichthys intestinalis TaxID=161448 RepID=UPI0025A500F5|nr:uncharacterized protein si:dkeyp-97a10.3 [Corythoichthys intestinalis]
MNQLCAFFVGFSLTVLVQSQDQVQIQFQNDPVLVRTGSEIQFTVQTIPDVISMRWEYEGTFLGLYAGGSSTINDVAQFNGRLTIEATQLRIESAQLDDAGSYTVEVEPLASTGLTPNSRAVQLRVFDAVSDVTLALPSVAIEGGNVTLTCTSDGTELTFQWGKDGGNIVEDGRITIIGGSLVINPGQRGDAGDYSCTVSNPVSSRSVTQSLTVFYGPDTPVLTKDAPKDCIGSADVQAGQVLRLTCTSESLPPAVFTWQRDGETVVSTQPDSGSLSVQTSSTDDSGRYTCRAQNAVTGGESERATDVSVENICLDGGEVAGIVIGSFLLLVILVVLIVLLVCLILKRRARQRQGGAVMVQKNHTNPRPLPLNPRANVSRDLDQGPDPPVFQSNTQTRRQRPNEVQALQLNSLQQNGTVPDFLGEATHNPSSYPLNGIDNAAFTRTDARQTNPNIVIQTGSAQGGGRPAGVQLSLAQGSQQNAQMPTIHVNLNSFPQQEAMSNAPQLIDTGQSNPRMQSRSATNPEAQPGLIPTGYTHSRTSQRNARTQTYPEVVRGTSSQQQMSWDRLRGTPAYPNETLPRGNTSDTTDYTNHPPLRQNPTQPRGRNPFREDTVPAGQGDRTRSQSADIWDSRTLRVPQLEPANHSHRSPLTERERTRPDARVLPGIQPSSSQDTSRSSNPFVNQQPAFRQSDPFSPDTRALSDPNHLLQGHVAHQQRPTRAQTQNQVTQIRSASQPRQTAPVSSQRQPTALTQAALKSHTAQAQTFQNRTQQTQAALLHSGPQAQPVSAAVGPRPPTPPPVIPLTQFQSLPRTHGHHKSHQHHPGKGGHHQHHAKVVTHSHAHARGQVPHAGNGRTAHATHPRQHQAHRGRPR